MIIQIKNDIKDAMRNKEKIKLSTLRMLLATIENERSKIGLSSIEDFTEEQIIALINRNIKALNQEIESLRVAGRITTEQQTQKQVLLSYLPEQLSEDLIRKEIELAMILVERGEINNPMQVLSKKLKGKADMGLVSRLVKEYK
ncbi:hypothetical protein PQE75_gp186 [Bacillus phage vB_BcoS-136]|uniref:Glutamyl-tRNA amidotransferase n=1 Tax=Bacillus phage vB_BcoS-136 TaxID=2419619 RepID=A0A3G3BVM8_9CAUD|nr:hypothetical protein PQE75_gp186 [Bacillus phage vB_BcoS-136]AYP68293.1 hypothetical protein vBBcoS136_00179 [Bacillus phage vB_BcoS-136]